MASRAEKSPGAIPARKRRSRKDPERRSHSLDRRRTEGRRTFQNSTAVLESAGSSTSVAHGDGRSEHSSGNNDRAPTPELRRALTSACSLGQYRDSGSCVDCPEGKFRNQPVQGDSETDADCSPCEPNSMAHKEMSEHWAIVLDRSGSMSTGTRIQDTKQAGKKLLDILWEMQQNAADGIQHYVSVLGFDTFMYPASKGMLPMNKANKDALSSFIDSRVRPSLRKEPCVRATTRLKMLVSKVGK